MVALEVLTQLDGRPWAVVLLGLLAFSLVNAVAEEFLFRGVLLTALAGVLPAAAAVAVQAVAFGAAHWGGFPSGWTGVALSCGDGAVLGSCAWAAGASRCPWPRTCAPT